MQKDLVYVAVANDVVYKTTAIYMISILSKAQTLPALKICKLFVQLVFTNEKSLKPLVSEGGSYFE